MCIQFYNIRLPDTTGSTCCLLGSFFINTGGKRDSCITEGSYQNAKQGSR